MTLEVREGMDYERLLEAAGWHMRDYKAANIHDAKGVAIQEFQLVDGHGHADYLLKTCGKSAGIFETMKQSVAVEAP